MKQNFEKAGLYIGQIVLTAIISSLIALLQNYLATHGQPSQDLINPTHAAAIGTVLSTGHVTYKGIKASILA